MSKRFLGLFGYWPDGEPVTFSEWVVLASDAVLDRACDLLRIEHRCIPMDEAWGAEK